MLNSTNDRNKQSVIESLQKEYDLLDKEDWTETEVREQIVSMAKNILRQEDLRVNRLRRQQEIKEAIVVLEKINSNA